MGCRAKSRYLFIAGLALTDIRCLSSDHESEDKSSSPSTVRLILRPAPRDFILISTLDSIATVVSPTILIEPEKTEEAAAEGETPVEGATDATDEETATTEEGKEKTTKPSDDKAKDKPGKTPDDKGKTESGDKGKSASKETKKK